MTGPTTIGTLAAIWRYPVKSMAGERLSSTDVTLQGIAADRRYAYVQTASRSPFPWLTGREMPAMLRYQPQWRDGSGDPSLWVCTPSGESLEIGSDALRDELAQASGREIHLHANHRGSYDAAAITFMANATVEGIAQASGTPPEPGRFRMNFYVATADTTPFQENAWVGKSLRVGETVRVALTERDQRCVMVTVAPHGGEPVPRVLRAIAQGNEACAGVYGSVLVAGRVREGDAVVLEG